MPNGDAAFAAGLPVADADSDARLGYDDINAVADALARIITNAWKQGVNTEKDISTTKDINALGSVITNVVRARSELRGRDAFIDFALTVGTLIKASNVEVNGDVTVQGVGLFGRINRNDDRLGQLELRVKALEDK